MTEQAEKKGKKRVGSIIFRIILIIIAGLTVGFGVYSWNASRVVGNELPMPFGFGISVIMSPSMDPVLKTNDLVVVTEKDSYDVDDIVVYQDGHMLVIHRIVDIDGETVTTKGDANNSPDSPIQMDDIKAKYVFRIPLIGLFVKYAKTIPGTLLILGIALYLLYRSRQKERAKGEEELDDIVSEIMRLRENLAEDGEAADKDASDDEEAAGAASEPAKEEQDGAESGDPETNGTEPDGEGTDTDTAEEASADSETPEEPSHPADEEKKADSEETEPPVQDGSEDDAE